MQMTFLTLLGRSGIPAPQGANGDSACAELLDLDARRLEPGFEIVSAKSRHDSPVLARAWRQLLDGSPSTEKIYQSPEFFRYMVDTADPAEGQFELLVINRKSDGEIVGIVPVRTITQSVDFRFGPRTLFGATLPCVQLLGSAPMLAAEPGLTRQLMHHLLEHFPGHHAISMQALPQSLYQEYCQGHGLDSYVFNGWRDCHTIALPGTFDAYLQKFSSKKRYNLARQVRQLAKEAGEVEVTRIEQPSQVAQMFAAMKGIISQRIYDNLPRQARFESVAANGMLLSYVITAGDEPVGVIVATRSGEVWHVHNIYSAPRYMHLSVGTSTVHLALEDLVTNFSFSDADFGYGTPNHDFRSTHVLKRRGHVMLYRPGSRVGLLLSAHRMYDGAHAALVKRVKQLKKKLDERRSAARRSAADAK